MRILLAARHPPNGKVRIGGVQSWCRTVAEELERRGHEVVFWGPRQALDGLFDAGILANVGDTRPAMRFCTRHLAMCHGIIGPERPAVRDVAFTSEEVRDFWQGSGPIIRQPIDLDYWQPKHTRRKRLVRFSYRDGLPYVPAVAELLGLDYVHLNDATPDDCRAVLQEAACVLASGRAVLEAMACGAPVVLCDDRPYQGPLLDTDIDSAMYRNYSGRGGVVPDQALLTATIRLALARGSLREHVETWHDARTITDEILCLLS